MSPSRRLPAFRAFALLLLTGLSLRGAPASAEEPPTSPPADKPAPPSEDDVPSEDELDSEDGPEEFVGRVNKAIENGVTWLKKKQGSDGSYGAIVGIDQKGY